jgi:hypothetical protein
MLTLAEFKASKSGKKTRAAEGQHNTRVPASDPGGKLSLHQFYLAKSGKKLFSSRTTPRGENRLPSSDPGGTLSLHQFSLAKSGKKLFSPRTKLLGENKEANLVRPTAAATKSRGMTIAEWATSKYSNQTGAVGRCGVRVRGECVPDRSASSGALMIAHDSRPWRQSKPTRHVIENLETEAALKRRKITVKPLERFMSGVAAILKGKAAVEEAALQLKKKNQELWTSAEQKRVTTIKNVAALVAITPAYAIVRILETDEGKILTQGVESIASRLEKSLETFGSSLVGARSTLARIWEFQGKDWVGAMDGTEEVESARGERATEGCTLGAGRHCA